MFVHLTTLLYLREHIQCYTGSWMVLLFLSIGQLAIHCILVPVLLLRMSRASVNPANGNGSLFQRKYGWCYIRYRDKHVCWELVVVVRRLFAVVVCQCLTSYPQVQAVLMLLFVLVLLFATLWWLPITTQLDQLLDSGLKKRWKPIMSDRPSSAPARSSSFIGRGKLGNNNESDANDVDPADGGTLSGAALTRKDPTKDRLGLDARPSSAPSRVRSHMHSATTNSNRDNNNSSTICDDSGDIANNDTVQRLVLVHDEPLMTPTRTQPISHIVTVLNEETHRELVYCRLADDR